MFLRFTASGSCFIKQAKKLECMKPFSLTRSTCTALVATIVDFAVLMSSVELLNFHYTIGTALGAALGATTNFLSNRYWAFPSHNEWIFYQAFKYVVVSCCSLVLNVCFVFCFTEWMHWNYLISKFATSILVAIAWNYPLHKYFVFKTKKGRRPTASKNAEIKP